MTGGEIVGAGRIIGAAGQKVFSEDSNTKEMLLKLAETTSEMAAAARSKAARVAVKERIKLKLYQPFALMIGVSKAYFDDTFPDEIAAKVEKIPDENLVTPLASIAVPVLHGLSYTFQEPGLKELYLNLLAAASDDRRRESAHPAFAEIIKQLSPDEAKWLMDVLKLINVPVVRLRKNILEEGGYESLYTHLLPVSDDHDKVIELENLPMWVDNWSRLGLVDVSYSIHIPDKRFYDWVEQRPEYLRLRADPAVGSRIAVGEGLMTPTEFGKSFFRAVAAVDNELSD